MGKYGEERPRGEKDIETFPISIKLIFNRRQQ